LAKAPEPELLGGGAIQFVEVAGSTENSAACPGLMTNAELLPLIVPEAGVMLTTATFAAPLEVTTAGEIT
jgi:hypothetical protein